MIEVKKFYESLVQNGFEFFAGVPDSLLKEFCLCLREQASEKQNIIAANEGNAVALAAGYHIATGKFGVVYMQNSGLGNAINPMLSLTDEKVYEIPVLYIIGYRGQPGIKDEPQHIAQGELTLPLLDVLGVKYDILDEDFETQINACYSYMQKEKKSIALVVCKGTFATYEGKQQEENPYSLTREDALEQIVKALDSQEFIVSTTGKTSREIYEIREKYGMSHANDFLTVGSMGHASSLATGMSLFSNKNIYCIDGDGALLMHMGALPIALQKVESNYKYILINNGCHESVGGQPTVSYCLDMVSILKGFGFSRVLEAGDEAELRKGIHCLQESAKAALIVYTNDKSWTNLGRPTTTPKENKELFETKLRSM